MFSDVELTATNICFTLGSGCDSVGRAFASNARDPWFESSHRQILFFISCIKKCIEKTKIKKKMPGIAHFFYLTFVLPPL